MGIPNKYKGEQTLPGPTRPFWGCTRCGKKTNFACRLQCLCGQSAPQHVIDKAIRVHEEQQKDRDEGWKVQRGSKRSNWQNSHTHSKETGKYAKELQQCKEEISKLKETLREKGRAETERAKASEKESAEDDEKEEEPAKEDIHQLHKDYQASLLKRGEGHEITKALKATLDAARTQRDDNKTIADTVKDTEKKQQSVENKIAAAEKKLTSQKEKVAEEQKKLQEQEESLQTLRQEQKELTTKLVDLRLQQVQTDKSTKRCEAPDPIDVTMEQLAKFLAGNQEGEAIMGQLGTTVKQQKSRNNAEREQQTKKQQEQPKQVVPQAPAAKEEGQKAMDTAESLLGKRASAEAEGPNVAELFLEPGAETGMENARVVQAINKAYEAGVKKARTELEGGPESTAEASEKRS